jgi:hypothetical protein
MSLNDERGYIVLPYLDMCADNESWNKIGNDGEEVNHQRTVKDLIEYLEVQQRKNHKH